MNRHILEKSVQDFLNDHLESDLSRIALSKSPFENVSSRELAEQLDGRKRAKKKLALWYQNPSIFYPPKLSMEQCSSELTALYKSQLIRGNAVIDLTGGFGVDAYYFSNKAKKVLHVEQNEELSTIAQHNAGILGATNIQFKHAESLEFLKNTTETFDTIYIDPSRRIESKKVFLLRHTEPDVVENLPFFFSKAPRLIIKVFQTSLLFFN